MLIAKITLTPLLILIVSMVSIRFGPGLAGLLTGFPIVAGPITGFLYLEQGSTFALQSAEATLLAVLPATIFCFAYCRAAPKFNIAWSLAIGLCFYFLAAYLTTFIQLPTLAVFLLVLASLTICLYLAPTATLIKSSGGIRSSELISRMSLSVVLVLVVTALAPIVGSEFSGYLAVFPVAAITMAVFTHLDSASAVVALLKGLIFGLFSLTTFYLVLIEMSEYLNFGQAFIAATISVVCLQTLLKITRSSYEKGKLSL